MSREVRSTARNTARAKAKSRLRRASWTTRRRPRRAATVRRTWLSSRVRDPPERGCPIYPKVYRRQVIQALCAVPRKGWGSAMTRTLRSKHAPVVAGADCQRLCLSRYGPRRWDSSASARYRGVLGYCPSNSADRKDKRETGLPPLRRYNDGGLPRPDRTAVRQSIERNSQAAMNRVTLLSPLSLAVLVGLSACWALSSSCPARRRPRPTRVPPHRPRLTPRRPPRRAARPGGRSASSTPASSRPGERGRPASQPRRSPTIRRAVRSCGR